MIGAADALTVFAFLPESSKDSGLVSVGGILYPQFAALPATDASFSTLIFGLIGGGPQSPDHAAPFDEKKAEEQGSVAGAALQAIMQIPPISAGGTQSFEPGTDSATAAPRKNPLAQCGTTCDGTPLEVPTPPARASVSLPSPSAPAPSLQERIGVSFPKMDGEPAPSSSEIGGKSAVDPGALRSPTLTNSALPQHSAESAFVEETGTPKHDRAALPESSSGANRLEQSGLTRLARDSGIVQHSESSILEQPTPMRPSVATLLRPEANPSEEPEGFSAKRHGLETVPALGRIAAAPDAASSRPVEEVMSTAPLTDRVVAHVTAHLDQLRESGPVAVQMTLHPPELGHVQLHLSVDDGHLSVRFLVQTDGAKSALDQQMEPMRVRFAELGFSLGQFDVRRDGSFANSQPPPDGFGPEAVRPVGKAEAGTVPRGYVSSRNANALVDVIV